MSTVYRYVCVCVSGSLQFKSVQSLSHVQLFVTPWTAACQAFLSITNSWSLLKLMYIQSVMPSNCLILPSPSPPAFNLSQHQSLFNEPVLHIRWPTYWSFSFQHQSFQWTPVSEVNQTEKEKYDIILLICGIFKKNDANELTNKRETDLKNKLIVTKGGTWEEGIN